MCLDCIHFHAPHAAQRQKEYHNSPNMQPIISCIQGHLMTVSFKTIERALSLLWACSIFFPFFIFSKVAATYAFHHCMEYDKTKVNPFKQDMKQHLYPTYIP